MSSSIDHQQVASELLRALRGRRSRPTFSRVLGYRTNIAVRWESGACFPTATRFFAIINRNRGAALAGVARFLRGQPNWALTHPLTHTSGVGALLRDLEGKVGFSAIAVRSGLNRYSVARWMKGVSDPKLPQLLALIDALSQRLLDFVAAWVDPCQLPSLVKAWKQLQTARQIAFEHPEAHAVLRVLELDGHRRRGRANVEWMAHRLGYEPERVEKALALLLETGQAKRLRHGIAPASNAWVDTGADPARSRNLKLAWVREALSRLEAGNPGHVGYSVFAVSRRDLQRLREVQLQYVRAMQDIIASSAPSECVALYSAQLLDLSAATDNVFASSQRAGRSQDGVS